MSDENRESTGVDIERRNYRRASLATLVRCATLGTEQQFGSCDICAGGMFLSTDSPLPIDSRVTLTFRLTDLDPPLVACRGRVIHSTIGDGMGIQFLNLRTDAREALQKFVDENP